MFRKFMILLAVVAVCGLVGCGEDKKTSKTGSKTESMKTGKTEK